MRAVVPRDSRVNNLEGEGALPDAPLLEAGRRLFAGQWTYRMSVKALDGLPPPQGVEVCLAGRSNVGKSSLINALTGRRTLARTSGTPGQTRALNFFDLAGGLVLVDMPGAGYARAGKAEIRDWGRLIDGYLRGRPNLRRVLLLVDARHGLMAADRALMAALDEAAVSYQIVLTKCDKENPAALEARVAELARLLRQHAAAHPTVIATSAVTGAGIAELRASLAQLLASPAIGYNAAPSEPPQRGADRDD